MNRSSIMAPTVAQNVTLRYRLKIEPECQQLIADLKEVSETRRRANLWPYLCEALEASADTIETHEEEETDTVSGLNDEIKDLEENEEFAEDRLADAERAISSVLEVMRETLEDIEKEDVSVMKNGVRSFKALADRIDNWVDDLDTYQTDAAEKEATNKEASK